ncbi:hypothetical protein ACQP1G_26715 [Nocardia sp. CA-107356]|uniref:hypothetical protein n=1 Tax=Nocardia sp. CA-107356 TaxID=3239972 RepID=UPI003D8F5C37
MGPTAPTRYRRSPHSSQTQLAPEQAARFTADSGRHPRPVSAISGALLVLFLDWLDGDVDPDGDEVVDYATRRTITILGLG